VTEFLEDVGLRTRPTATRSERPVSRASLHRILKDDYYTGIVTRGGVKCDGSPRGDHRPRNFRPRAEIIDGHKASGDRSHKHHHYLKGSIFCACGKRLGYGRHRGKSGGVCEYFPAWAESSVADAATPPTSPSTAANKAIVRRYKRETLSPQEREAIRQAKAAQAGQKRPRTAKKRTESPQNDHDPVFRGRGSNIDQMAEREGFEPSMEFNPHTRLAGECLQPLGHLSRNCGSPV
jgi:site-specific DNA recombinase